MLKNKIVLKTTMAELKMIKISFQSVIDNRVPQETTNERTGLISFILNEQKLVDLERYVIPSSTRKGSGREWV